MNPMRTLAAFLLLTLVLAGSAEAAAPKVVAPDVVLITLDTTRADYLGSYGARGARTPVLDGLARRGTRWARAVTPSPLTLPAHASLLTGLAPPEHGVRDNGTAVLPAQVPTLATALSARGYATAAVVASRVLDRRFGLARGFASYDDKTPAEQIGEYGYPERNARQVTDAALEWLARRPAGKPFFLWVHYYDPHAPYESRDGATQTNRLYAGEIAYMDREIGRLLAELPGGGARTLIAAVGDHGEMLGEHGERQHGLFLYKAALEVPLIVAGPGVPAAKVVAEAAPTRRLAATLLRLAGAGKAAAPFGPPLPGLPLPGLMAGVPAGPIYSETHFPLSAYGWSPLQSVFDGRWKLIVAPKPELYDLAADPAESRNLLDQNRDEARRLKGALQTQEREFARRKVAPQAPDRELARSLQSLGYAAGSGTRGKGTIDPKDGAPLLEEFRAAKELTERGQPKQAAEKLAALVKRSPGNVPFLTALAAAQLASGEGETALATYRRAAQENPGLDFLHLNLADAYRRLGRVEAARKEYALVLELNPRFAAAWWNLADLAEKAGKPAEARQLLAKAVSTGTESVSILVRLAELEIASGDAAAADRHLRQAVDLAPSWVAAWLVWGQQAEKAGRLDEALDRYLRAANVAPAETAPLLGAGRVLQKKGDKDRARRYLERVASAAPQSAEGREAKRLLDQMR